MLAWDLFSPGELVLGGQHSVGLVGGEGLLDWGRVLDTGAVVLIW